MTKTPQKNKTAQQTGPEPGAGQGDTNGTVFVRHTFKESSGVRFTSENAPVRSIFRVSHAICKSTPSDCANVQTVVIPSRTPVRV